MVRSSLSSYQGRLVGGLSTYTNIMPYGTNGTTGTGGTGTSPPYALSGTPARRAPDTIFDYAVFLLFRDDERRWTAGGVATARPPPRLEISSLILVLPFGGSLGNLAMLWGKIPTQAGGAPSTADLASICTKQTDIQTYAASNTAGNPIKVNSLYRLNDLGIWGDSGDRDYHRLHLRATGTPAQRTP